MLLTIARRTGVAGLVLLLAWCRVDAQTPPESNDPFAAHAWHFEAGLHGAVEAWNYNVSHEELLGLSEGLSYGVRQGLLLTMTQHVYYVSQRANDSWLLGLTVGLRARVYRRNRTSVFVDGAVGISDAAIAAPPRGTRFNYLALGGAGMLIRVRPRIHALAALQWLHVSNNSLKGPGRNPDIEAVGPRVGVVIRF